MGAGGGRHPGTSVRPGDACTQEKGREGKARPSAEENP